jgi:putative toxin-antitoxin system antitoxin component (TIGR02293 family)
MASATASSTLVPAAFHYDWRQVERGLPLTALEDFAAYSGIDLKAILEVVIPLRTLKHRRQRQEPLSLEESDRLGRVARMYELAARVYGDREDGKDWLLEPKERFDGKTALAMLRSTAGERAVEEFLIQIDEGMFI